MKRAFKRNKQRVGDINARIEDNLSGIRVVKSFGNESHEIIKFHDENSRYVSSKKNSYFYMGKFDSWKYWKLNLILRIKKMLIIY